MIHRGCYFWEGHKQDATTGRAYCQYAKDNLSSLVKRTVVQVYPPTATATVTLNPPIFPLEDELEVTFGNSDTGPWQTAAEVSRVVTPAAAVNGQVASFTVTNVGGTTLTRIRVRVLQKDRPIPHHSLCAFYDEDADDKNAAYRSKCGQQSVKPCPFYRPQGPRMVATYEAKASNGAEWANLERGMPPGSKKSPMETAYGQAMYDMAGAAGGTGFGVASWMAYNFIGAVQTPDPYTAGLPKESRMTAEVTFESEKVALEGKQRYYATKDG